MSTPSDIPKPLLPEIKKWLSANQEKINSFWLYADWRMWARFDLYAHLTKTLGQQVRDDHPRWDYSITHSKALFDDRDDNVPDVDMTFRACDENTQVKEIAIWICAARPDENCTSFEDFVKKMNEEWELVKGLTKKYGGGDLEGGKLLFLCLGEKPYEEYEDFKVGGLDPEVFGVGGNTMYESSLYMYYLWLDLVEDKGKGTS